jgi:hypothetical protein
MRVVSFPPSFLTFWDSGEKEFGHLKMRFEWVYIEKERIVCDYASVAFSILVQGHPLKSKFGCLVTHQILFNFLMINKLKKKICELYFIRK